MLSLSRYMIQDAKGWVGTTIYFLAVIIFGNFFLLNIMLAVVWEAYSSQALQEEDDEVRQLV